MKVRIKCCPFLIYVVYRGNLNASLNVMKLELLNLFLVELDEATVHTGTVWGLDCLTP